MNSGPSDKKGVLLPPAVYLEVNRLTAGMPAAQEKWQAVDMLHAFARFCKACFAPSAERASDEYGPLQQKEPHKQIMGGMVSTPGARSHPGHGFGGSLESVGPAPAASELRCCTDGEPLRVDPCAACPTNPHNKFRGWIDAYGHKTAYDRGDMAASWYAGKRSAAASARTSTPIAFCPACDKEWQPSAIQPQEAGYEALSQQAFHWETKWREAEQAVSNLRHSFERECQDGDMISAALGVQRTEGGSLMVARMVNRVKHLQRVFDAVMVLTDPEDRLNYLTPGPEMDELQAAIDEVNSD